MPALDDQDDDQPAENFIEPPFEPRFAPFQPFPVECFPDPVRDYVLAQAAALDCDAATLALPVLSVLASSVGGSRRIQLKATKTEPAVLWTAIVADSRTGHRAPLEAAVAPLEERQAVAFRALDKRLAEYEQNRAENNRPYRNADGSPAVVARAQEPTADRFVTRDWRVETLIQQLSRRPRGVLAQVDELDGWLGRINPSGNRRCLELGQWQDFYDGRSLVRESPTGKQREFRIPHAAISVTGSVGARTLSQKFLKSHDPCELTSRLLFAQPPSLPESLTDDEVDDEVLEGYDSVVRQLLALQYAPAEREKTNTTRVDVKANATEGHTGSPPSLSPQPSALGNAKANGTEGHGRDHTATQPAQADEWQDPAETIVLVMKKPRFAGPGVTDDFSPTRPVDPPPPVPTPARPEFDKLTEIVVGLSRKSRRRLEGFANGLGWGSGPADLDLCAFFHAIKPYVEKHGLGDPRSDGVPEQTGLASTSTGSLAADLVPALVKLSAEARSVYVRFTENVRADLFQVDDVLIAWFANLTRHAARLALVLHLARWASGEQVDPAVCDLTSMQHGITLANWFAREAQRVVAEFSISVENQEQFKLIDWLRRRHGVATTRDLCRSNGRKYPTDQDAEIALNRLAATGVGYWVDIPAGKRGGQPYRVLSMGKMFHEHLLPEEEEEVTRDEEKVTRGEREVTSGEWGVTSEDGEVMANERGVASGARQTRETGAETLAVSTTGHAVSKTSERGTPSTGSRPAGQRWTIEELVAADPRERLDGGSGKTGSDSESDSSVDSSSPPPDAKRPTGRGTNGRRKKG